MAFKIRELMADIRFAKEPVNGPVDLCPYPSVGTWATCRGSVFQLARPTGSDDLAVLRTQLQGLVVRDSR
jgi:hypothetical protein